MRRPPRLLDQAQGCYMYIDIDMNQSIHVSESAIWRESGVGKKRERKGVLNMIWLEESKVVIVWREREQNEGRFSRAFG